MKPHGLAGSDKHYWHRYTDAYTAAFRDIKCVRNIVEFGVAAGDSIAWLASQYPAASIVGVDIASQSPSWPQSPNITYVQLDQGRRQSIAKMFERLGKRHDLIIEDGSHIPQHQASCLIESLPWLQPGGLYVLEDVHTSHPGHPLYRKHCRARSSRSTSLAVLLAIQHAKELGRSMPEEVVSQLVSHEFFTSQEIKSLSQNIETIDLYRRSRLPLRCWKCGSEEFQYRDFRCSCGEDVFGCSDSMSFLLKKIGE